VRFDIAPSPSVNLRATRADSARFSFQTRSLLGLPVQVKPLSPRIPPALQHFPGAARGHPIDMFQFAKFAIPNTSKLHTNDQATVSGLSPRLPTVHLE